MPCVSDRSDDGLDSICDVLFSSTEECNAWPKIATHSIRTHENTEIEKILQIGCDRCSRRVREHVLSG